jgi:hypothetical protein
MVSVVADADVIGQLPPRSNVLSPGLTDYEWARLIVLPGFGSTARSDVRGTGAAVVCLT